MLTSSRKSLKKSVGRSIGLVGSSQPKVAVLEQRHLYGDREC